MAVECTDFMTVFDTLEKGKWHKVSLHTMYYNHKQITEWLNTNATRGVQFHAALFLFEDKRDAAMFALRWGHI